MINVLVLTDENIVSESYIFTGENYEARAEKQFLQLCEDYVSNWDEYTTEDIDDSLGEGYVKFGHGYVVINHPTLNPDITK